MPVNPTYPGVYVEELPSGVRTITGVATSITAFIGRALRGPVDQAERVQSFGAFSRLYGGLSLDCPMSFAVEQYFRHGGQDAIIVRVHNGDVAAETATANLTTAGGPLTIDARSPGTWGNRLRMSAADNGDNPLIPAGHYILTVQELAAPGSSTIVATETFLNVSNNPDSPRHIQTVLEQQSQLVRVELGFTVPNADITSTITNAADPNDAANFVVLAGGDDGSPITDDEIYDAADPNFETNRRGLYALEAVDLFNMLYIPPFAAETDVGDSSLARAGVYCKEKRAVLILDLPDVTTVAAAETALNSLRTNIGASRDHAAAYFPRLRMPNPLRENQLSTFPPGASVAGIIARTDTERGIWKAPAGLDASFSGVQGFTYKLTDGENGILNPLGLNCLRSFPVYGNIVWGARTLDGADIMASEWKYLPIRRTALYIEESLFRGLHWAVFEPNDESLWSQIRLNAGNFMQDLFRKGAFQGNSPRDAYLVKCDAETNPQNQIDQGIVTVLVGFAPLKPAEFVIIQIQQLAGQSGA
ncbi:MAG: phage tail sheath subtilisin-like domain-containing protein [Anaerolineae bacterium]|nr:phage tail sheath subtilisin-like domain-containing protein [Anaerolineae bacterium]